MRSNKSRRRKRHNDAVTSMSHLSSFRENSSENHEWGKSVCKSCISENSSTNGSIQSCLQSCTMHKTCVSIKWKWTKFYLHFYIHSRNVWKKLEETHCSNRVIDDIVVKQCWTWPILPLKSKVEDWMVCPGRTWCTGVYLSPKFENHCPIWKAPYR